MTVEDDLRGVAALAQAALAGVTPGGATPEAAARLGVLLAEMRDLVQILPVAGDVYAEGRADLVAMSEDDAVEAGFDNFPV